MQKPLYVSGIVLGTLLCLGPLLGLLGTVLGMMHSFNRLADAGSANPEQLAHDISFSMYTTLAGIAILPVGIILLILSIVGLVRFNQNRDKGDVHPPHV